MQDAMTLTRSMSQLTSVYTTVDPPFFARTSTLSEEWRVRIVEAIENADLEETSEEKYEIFVDAFMMLYNEEPLEVEEAVLAALSDRIKQRQIDKLTVSLDALLEPFTEE